MGVQGWRYGFFYSQMIAQWPQAVKNMTYEDRYLLEEIFAYKFSSRSFFARSFRFRSDTFFAAPAAAGGGFGEAAAAEAAPISAPSGGESQPSAPSAGAPG